jgi:hypothetical protein
MSWVDYLYNEGLLTKECMRQRVTLGVESRA